jgi:ABC-type spermidine/putrescine transport system permease subunit II
VLPVAVPAVTIPLGLLLLIAAIILRSWPGGRRNDCSSWSRVLSHVVLLAGLMTLLVEAVLLDLEATTGHAVGVGVGAFLTITAGCGIWYGVKDEHAKE